jgi:hypothetical protein
MTNIIPVPQEEAQARLRRLALEGISSNSTRRAYSAAMDEFLTWAQYQIPAGFSKAQRTNNCYTVPYLDVPS